ncbi:SoxR reducing system RseC family protein [[Haemophilus] ducreyi]|uniref:SoxR reducing system RseC family protein n=1 Tax=Haemophilus ducreyi TaxID=730 RepID=UPI000655F251|nr:SoxR reducing system RseC family protein [[Haemophilus] ducreyi]AKO45454.1 sigma-E factor regulatory protein [[Haemophilus] ducreyi]AKO46841.1 sigma-E factor regulatory protein [[Haemophilus] ducreyi]AKO48180.1 sigma-E factor regulatory protein [[Haemophilus] ducreyi]AKO49571.1 sigma-E factor regulatory protein [[Haemophilus] ducreyi]ANF62483.1 transcriptional regulator [[Haemophilus] ducreyi]
MMVETATVVHYQNGKALVRCSVKTACGNCGAKADCGTQLLSSLVKERVPHFELSVNMPLVAGDMVKIGLPEQTLLWSIFWIYVVPLMVLIGSAVGFTQLFANELVVVFMMFICTSMTFFSIKKIIDKKQLSQLNPIFLGRVE